ncbi:branched-chain amino acid ABC transporter permease [Chloroflexota bacterium]
MLTDVATPLTMGILLGGLYGLIALGLSLIFGVMKLINVAHGDFVILSSYLAFTALSVLHIDPLLSMIIIVPILFGVGWLVQRYLLNKAFRISMEAPLIIAFGLSLIIQNLCQIIWTPLARGLTTSYALRSFDIGPIHLPLVYVFDFVAALIVMLSLREFLKRSYLGKAIIASSQDEKAALLMGINTTRIYIFTFALAIALGGLSGIFLGLTFPFVPTSGVSFLIIAFGVVILGGLGSVLGTLVGGIIFGLAQTLGGYFFGATAQLLVPYVLVLVILGSRPQGIFGR